MLLVEPSVGVEQRVTRRVRLNLAAAYRLVGGVEQAGLKAGDGSGPSAVLTLKIGRF
jgi:hypothetical protein